MEQVYDYLKANKDEIIKNAKEGNKLCKEIISVYGLHVACPCDPGAKGILMNLVEDHMKQV
jgi:hypothetical protein